MNTGQRGINRAWKEWESKDPISYHKFKNWEKEEREKTKREWEFTLQDFEGYGQGNPMAVDTYMKLNGKSFFSGIFHGDEEE